VVVGSDNRSGTVYVFSTDGSFIRKLSVIGNVWKYIVAISKDIRVIFMDLIRVALVL